MKMFFEISYNFLMKNWFVIIWEDSFINTVKKQLKLMVLIS